MVSIFLLSTLHAVADDTTLILDGTRESLSGSLQLLDGFYVASGLRLNDKKTEALWIGANCGKEEMLLTGRNLKWLKYKVKTLEFGSQLIRKNPQPKIITTN